MSQLTAVPADLTPLAPNDTPAYLRSKYALEVSRQTVYNWMNVGRNGEKLTYAVVPGLPGSLYASRRFTSQQWVDEFLRRSGICG